SPAGPVRPGHAPEWRVHVANVGERTVVTGIVVTGIVVTGTVVTGIVVTGTVGEAREPGRVESLREQARPVDLAVVAAVNHRGQGAGLERSFAERGDVCAGPERGG